MKENNEEDDEDSSEGYDQLASVLGVDPREA